MTVTGTESHGPPRPAAPLARATQAGYGVGGLAMGVFASVPGLLLPIYMTDTLGIPAALAGIAVFVPRLWDGISDPFMGIISDRTRTRWGRRRPYILAAALLLPIFFAVLFRAPADASVVASFAHVLVAYLLCATAFTLFSVPYVAMPAEMTRDYHEGTSLMSWRMVFTVLGVLVAGAAPLIVKRAGGGHEGYAAMSLIIAAILLVSIVGSFFGTARAPFRERSERTVGIGEQLRAAARNRPFLIVVSVFVLQFMAFGCLAAVLPYFAKYVIARPGQTHEAVFTAMFASLILASTVTMPLWTVIAKRIGKKRAYTAALIGFAACAITLLGAATRPQALVYAHFAVIGVCYGGILVYPYSMLADTLLLDRVETGLRREGVFSGLWMTANKGGLAMGALTAGVALGVAGFIETRAGELAVQPASALRAIELGITVVPATFVAFAVFVLSRYELTEARVRELASRDRDAPSQPA